MTNLVFLNFLLSYLGNRYKKKKKDAMDSPFHMLSQLEVFFREYAEGSPLLDTKT